VNGSDAAFGRAKVCIFLCKYGSPAQHEAFDPKLDAAAESRWRGDIPSPRAVPEIRICDHLPGIGGNTDRLAVVCSLPLQVPPYAVEFMATRN